MFVHTLFLLLNILLMKTMERVDFMCNQKKENCNCISEILLTILLLQKNSGQSKKCLETCDKGFLGESTSSCCYNTRPIMIFNNCGDVWSMPTSKTDIVCNNEVTTSCVFRIEKLDDCCATFRVLESTNNTDWTATDSFFTIDLTCACAIKCLPDTFIDLCV